ncbi:MAG: Ppx/GppA phosphatase family protein [Kiloniellales bacterium]
MAVFPESETQGARRAGADAVSAPEVYAALDLGTNNCRLLIAKGAAGGFEVIDAFSRIVRLGEGVSRSGRLSEAAMARTLKALRICAGKIRRNRVTRVRAVATEACRRARNRDAFLARVFHTTGLELEIIATDEEARLAIHGCAQLLDPEVPQALVFDIGGGSTELGWTTLADTRGRRRGMGGLHLEGWESIPTGVVALSERHGGRQVGPETYEIMIAEMRAALAPFEAKHSLAPLIAAGQVQMLGTSGTVTTLVGVHKRLPRYDRAQVDGSYLKFGTVRSLTRRIAAMSYRTRVEHPCIGPERADLVIAGCAIVEAVCATWPVGRLRVADRGLREGILHLLIAGSGDPNAKAQGSRDLAASLT